MFPDPLVNEVREPLVEFIEVLRNDESIVPDKPPVSDRERVSVSVFNRKIDKSDRLVFSDCSIAQHRDTSFERSEFHASKRKERPG